jgi:hypothetical protein
MVGFFSPSSAGCHRVFDRCKSVSNTCKKASTSCHGGTNHCNRAIWAATAPQTVAKQPPTVGIPPLTFSAAEKIAAIRSKTTATSPRTTAKDTKSSAIASSPAYRRALGPPRASPRLPRSQQPGTPCYAAGGAGGGVSSVPGRWPRSLMVRASSYLATRSAPSSLARRGRMRSSMT